MKTGRDADLEKQANELLKAHSRPQTNSLERDIEKMKYEHGFISEDELEHYDPTNDWDAIDSAYQIVTGADDLDYVDGTADAENIIERNAELLQRRKLMQHADDNEEPVIDGAETIPPLGANTGWRKTCTCCGRSKGKGSFGRDSRNKDGHRSWCHSCEREAERERYTRNHQ